MKKLIFVFLLSIIYTKSDAQLNLGFNIALTGNSILESKTSENRLTFTHKPFLGLSLGLFTDYVFKEKYKIKALLNYSNYNSTIDNQITVINESGQELQTIKKVYEINQYLELTPLLLRTYKCFEFGLGFNMGYLIKSSTYNPTPIQTSVYGQEVKFYQNNFYSLIQLSIPLYFGFPIGRIGIFTMFTIPLHSRISNNEFYKEYAFYNRTGITIKLKKDK